MKIEITIDCIDDTRRIPRGHIITWIVKGDSSRDARIRKVTNDIAAMLKQTYPNPKRKS